MQSGKDIPDTRREQAYQNFGWRFQRSSCVTEMRDRFEKRRDILLSGLREMNIECVTPAGAFYVFPWVGDGDRTAADLAERGVITVPGSAFGIYGAEHIRMSYATSEADIVRALDRMREGF